MQETQSSPVFLPGKFQGQKSLVGYSPWGHKELGMTEQAHMHTHAYKSGSHVSGHQKSLEDVFQHRKWAPLPLI